MIGINDIGYGPSGTTDFWNGISAGASGYTLYSKRDAVGEPDIRTFANDTALIDYTQDVLGQTSITTISAALKYYSEQTGTLATNRDYEDIVTANCIFNYDFGFSSSYSKGTTGGVYDLSEEQYDGSTIYGGSSYNADGGGSIDFDGTDGYIGLGKSFINTGEIGSGNVPYTLEAWIKLDVTPGATTSGWSIIGNASSNGVGLQVMDSSGTKVNFGYRSNSNFNSISSLSNNVWYHVVGTREVGVNNYIYINGSEDQTASSADIDVNADTTEMQIGYAATRITGRFNGKIGLVRMYDSHLTAAQVLQNFNAQKGRYGY